MTGFDFFFKAELMMELLARMLLCWWKLSRVGTFAFSLFSLGSSVLVRRKPYISLNDAFRNCPLYAFPFYSTQDYSKSCYVPLTNKQARSKHAKEH